MERFRQLTENKIRDLLIEFCKEKGNEERRGEYKISDEEFIGYLREKYSIPRYVAEWMVSILWITNRINFGASKNGGGNWFYIEVEDFVRQSSAQ